jgi:dolichol kinase
MRLLAPEFLCASVACAVALFTLCDTLRYLEMPGIAFASSSGSLASPDGRSLVTSFYSSHGPSLHAVDWLFAPVRDERDQGRLVLTPLYLLLGITFPVWLSPTLNDRPLPAEAFSGLVALGLGDACAAVMGSL